MKREAPTTMNITLPKVGFIAVAILTFGLINASVTTVSAIETVAAADNIVCDKDTTSRDEQQAKFREVNDYENADTATRRALRKEFSTMWSDCRQDRQPSHTRDANESSKLNDDSPTPTPSMTLNQSPAPTTLTPSGNTLTVTNSNELKAALETVRPGETIYMHEGSYPGQFHATTTGTIDSPIVLTGSEQAVIEGSSTSIDMSEACDCALHLEGVDYWNVHGIGIHGGQKGVMADIVNHTIFSELNIWGTKMEGLHLRSNSSNNIVRDNWVHDTGSGPYAEGIYVGASVNNWGVLGPADGPDRSDNNLIENNTIANTGGESIDVKEATTGTILRGNKMDGTGMAGGFPDSCVDIKGTNVLVESNSCDNFIKDGYQWKTIKKSGFSASLHPDSKNNLCNSTPCTVVLD